MIHLLSTSKKELHSFLLVGLSGNFISWIVYSIIYSLLTIENFKPTLSWLGSFHFGVVLQHYLHRRFTFQALMDDYFISLRKTYFSYIGVFIFGLMMNYYFNEILGLYHHISWVMTLVATVPASFFLLKVYAFKKMDSNSYIH